MQSGNSHWMNQYSKDMVIEFESSDRYRWYSAFLSVFGKSTALSISINRFYKDFFLYCYDLTSTPSAMPVDPNTGEPLLNLVTSGSIDISLTFNKPVEENLVLYAIGQQKAIAEFTVDGIPAMLED